ncbi:DCC1-like thiol-disulfide oxidoreductase family protein [Luteolibacter arcticus]|uniref:DCC1-like thiol-disulfide oxidoreductase family protein n=1 Tax=Luteolibacter arcticus TaxID=1581411 RepID=A0ABT3GJT4_9BACT|nr:DCC1-like thiol-disulfide oxidoreductase family protein [Luteolibacter arcticus]MCW1923750.1 DCC1-like thiol-disulfide oxidoreductase family protein [Luteolibacter arcticus]
MDRSDLIVLAFDGDCLMCSRSIRFLAEHDPRRRFRFVKLQSPLGQSMEERAGTGVLNTALVETDGQIFSRSDAVLRVMHGLGGQWRILSWIGRFIIPRTFRDRAYDFIAARRHKWFGKGDACSMPSEALRERLL